ncbi:hypothetical protein INT48_005122 [Thamnidium elegans]|uniref:PAS domain-containing protein n=1 Tax=Thamnidium elegans TaxID=101142 RepID=A0A8H7W016_9FUNG|nr:hypothetical protein INT48_005122 [Thamnidium elegans]
MTDHNNNSPHSNTFLKNLSQKKYAWMEEASSITTPPFPVNKTGDQKPSESSPRPQSQPQPHSQPQPQQQQQQQQQALPKKIKKQRLSPEPETPKKHKNIKSPPSVPMSNDTCMDNVEMKVETPADKEVVTVVKENITPTRPQPHFKYTTFPVKGYNILPTRNITSTFARNDTTYFPGSKAGAEEISPDPEEEWRDTIIIHPGSRNLRLGFASEAFPKCVPHVIARRFKNKVQQEDMDMTIETEEDEEKRQEALQEIRGELKWRMKNAKRRAVPNAEAQVIGFNTTAFKETILDHNDPYKALNLPIPKDCPYRILYPWKYGTFNSEDYTSLNAVLSDIEAIWTESIINELQVEKSDFKNFNVVIVVPDNFHQTYLCELVTMLLRYMNFRGVIIQQESTCATYGAGVSSAVVVDIGAQKTNITCIEDGVCQVDSRISIAIGGDDITKTFASFLLANKFPYENIDLSTTFDWRLAEGLKEKWCTMNEADISVQVYDFFTRTPFKPTLKYQCKVYDEVFLAPLCLVYPDILENKKKVLKSSWSSSNDSSNMYQSYPIDIAIAQSILNTANGSEEKLKRYFTSIILVGGGGKIANFSKVLEDRVLSTVLAQRAFIDRVEVLPAPRELDPEVLVWKGASVMAKLDIAKDMWIGAKEWDQVGARLLRERALLIVVFASESVYDILGYTPEELIGHPGYHFTHPDEHEALALIHTTNVDEQRMSSLTTYRSRHKNGTRRMRINSADFAYFIQHDGTIQLNDSQEKMTHLRAFKDLWGKDKKVHSKMYNCICYENVRKFS